MNLQYKEIFINEMKKPVSDKKYWFITDNERLSIRLVTDKSFVVCLNNEFSAVEFAQTIQDPSLIYIKDYIFLPIMKTKKDNDFIIDIITQVELKFYTDAWKIFKKGQDYYCNDDNASRWEELEKLIKKAITKYEKLETSKEDDSSPEIREAFPFMNDKGYPMMVWENTEYICNKYNIKIRYNTLKKNDELFNKPKYSNDRLKSYKNLTYDSCITEIQTLCEKSGLRLSENMLVAHIRRIAEEYKYNPVQKYLKECLELWEAYNDDEDYRGRDLIEEVFDNFILDDTVQQDREFLLFLFRKWLITCVIMAFNDDARNSAQGVLILKGKQGIQKTRFLTNLVLERDWTLEGISLNPKNKDDIARACSYFICELGEFNSTMRKDRIDDLKNFITARKDAYRSPYERKVKEHPRMTTFFASINDDQFLKDDTGERRYWIISIKGIKDFEADHNMLWGQLMHLAFVEKERHWLTLDEIDKLNKHNEIYKIISSEEQIIRDSLNWNAPKEQWKYFNATEVAKMLDIDMRKTRVVGKALKRLQSLGVEIPKNHREYKYLIPPIKIDLFKGESQDFTNTIPSNITESEI